MMMALAFLGGAVFANMLCFALVLVCGDKAWHPWAAALSCAQMLSQTLNAYPAQGRAIVSNLFGIGLGVLWISRGRLVLAQGAMLSVRMLMETARHG